jgi:hypothetical protein
MDRLTKDFIKFEGVLLVILVVLICLLFASCTKTEYITVEKVRNDTTYINKVQRDSIYLHDSTFVKVAGDTVWIERWHTKWQNHVEHDTVYKARTDSVPVPYPVKEYIEKPLKGWQKTLMFLGVLSILMILIWIWRTK